MMLKDFVSDNLFKSNHGRDFSKHHYRHRHWYMIDISFDIDPIVCERPYINTYFHVFIRTSKYNGHSYYVS